MPENAKLTAWPKELPEWDSLSWDEKKLFIKQADVYGTYLAYTGHQIGRINGTSNEFMTFNGVRVPQARGALARMAADATTPALQEHLHEVARQYARR